MTTFPSRCLHPLRVGLVALCVAAIAACALPIHAAQAQDGPSLVILVRHAEKAAVPGDDPPLSEVGQLRALALAQALEGSPPSAIVVSSRQRTALTAAAVVAATGVTPTVVGLDGGGAAHIAAVAAAVKRQRGVVLVVGHSNTVPAIVKALGGPTLPDICDETYSHLFLLSFSPGASAPALVMARFGANEPPPPATCAGMIPR